MSDRHEQIARFVQRNPTLRPLLLWPHQIPPHRRPPYPTVLQIAEELLADSEFQVLQLATWLRSPDGKLIADAVALVIPLAYRAEYELAVEALQVAAEMQYEQGWPQRAAGFVALGVVSIFGLKAIVPAVRHAA
jgi:hypothetical protein